MNEDTEYQMEFADKKFTKIISELEELKKQYKLFVDNDELMKIKKSLRYYKGRANMYKIQYLNLKSVILKKLGKNYYRISYGEIRKIERVR